MTRRYRWTVSLSAVVASVALVSGCSLFQGPPFDAGLTGREMYLCCTTRFSSGFAATDANYGLYYADQHLYAEGPILLAGTKVLVTEVRAAGVSFRPHDSPMNYNINFGYGKKVLSPAEYFAKILLPADPTADLSVAAPMVATEIQAGRLMEGMTKAQALMARGYPPAHRTPDLGADQWLYYQTPGVVDQVHFVGGKISEISRGPAPQ